MTRWATEAEGRLAKELKKENPQAKARKKKALKWCCTFGWVELFERMWKFNGRQRYHRLLAAKVAVRANGYSRRARRVISDFAAEHSYRRAGDRIREHYGLELNPSAIGTITMQVAQACSEMLEKEYAKAFRALEPKGKKVIIAQADGSLVSTVPAGKKTAKRARDWREIRITSAVADQEVDPVYAATMGSVEEVGRRWGHCARQAGRGLKSKVHALGDGAEWIRLQSEEVFGQQGQFLCDFYHVGEYLAAAAERCRPSKPRQWLKTQQRRLRSEKLSKMLEDLEEHLEAPGVPEKEAPVRQCYRYLTNRRENLNYSQAEAQGLPIGSGQIESGHKHVLQARLKQAGMAWLPDNAHKMAQLRVVRANNDWNALWN